MVNVNRKVKLGRIAIDNDDEDLSTLLSCSKGFAQNFLCYALNQKIETDAGMQDVSITNLLAIVSKSVINTSCIPASVSVF